MTRPICPCCSAPLPDATLSQAVSYHVTSKRTLGDVGAPRSRKLRCPCGAMTARRAKTRGHKCVGKERS